jgi:hypothetical protein
MERPRAFERFTAWLNRPSESDRAAGLELAVSARRFSRRTKAVVDDKLSFSAALMRAGEVEAANQMLAEVQKEVLTEEVALLERVNEVKVAQSMEPKPTTRARLARTLAVAMIGSSVLAFSAAGAMVAGFFDNDDQAIHGPEPEVGAAIIAEARGDRVRDLRRVNVANVPLTMTSEQFRRYTALTSGKIDEDGLELFLLRLLPPALAEKVHYALVAGIETLPESVEDELVAAAGRLDHQQRRAAADENEPAEQPSDEPSAPQPSPEPSDTGEPADEPTPEPTEEPEDEGDGIPFIGDDDDEGGS